jgi:RNA polymerase sigma factor (sigma-70 family)
VGNEAEFRAKNSWEKIVNSPEPPSSPRAKAGFPPVAAEHLQHIFQQPILTREQEVYLFRKMNYLKFVAHEVKETFSTKKVEPSKVARVDELLTQAAEIRDRIVERNLRLVLGIGLKFLPGEMDKCVSIGVIPLMEALEKFDYQLGNKFSTFATQPIRWKFLQYRQNERRPREAFHSVALNIGEFDIPDRSESGTAHQTEARVAGLKLLVEQQIKKLEAREREIVVRRYGLLGQEPQTLKEVGEFLGITKERVRQIESRALEKLFGLIPVDEAFPD